MAMLAKRPQKVYEYDMPSVQAKLVGALRRRRGATVADLVTDTSLPKMQVEEAMRHILDEYVGHLEATESGELLYTFPTGMRNQVRGFWPAFRRGAREAVRGILKALGFLFKVWIAVMLVGYFALFVALFVLALLASVAGSMASRGQGGRASRSRGPGIGGFFLVGRIIDLLFIRILLNSGARRDRGEKGRPLYRSVFAYVFGEKDPEKEWEERERTAILRFVRSHKGVVSLEEVIRLCGRGREEAERLVTRLLVEYEGEPVVTERGTILYFFPELLRTRAAAIEAERGTGMLPRRPLVPWSDNKPKTTRWISFFNAFNLVFGGYFLYYAATVLAEAFSPAGPAGFFVFVYRLVQRYLGIDPLPLLGIGLGLVPVAFSVIFFLVSLVRRARLARRNEEIRQRNLRRDIYGAVLARPEVAIPDELAAEAAERDSRATASERREPPRVSRGTPRPLASPTTRQMPRDARAFVSREIDELAAAKDASVEQGASGSYQYRFSELAQEMDDVEKYRRSIDLSRFDVGKTVFDSAE